MNTYKKVLKSLDEALNSGKYPVIKNAADYKHVKSIDYHGKTYESVYNFNYYYNAKKDILINERCHEDEGCCTLFLIDPKIKKDPKFPYKEYEEIGDYHGMVGPFDDRKNWVNGDIELELTDYYISHPEKFQLWTV